MWWTAILDFISNGLAGKVLDAYKARLQSGDEHDRLAADLASRDIAARVELSKTALSHWWSAWPMVMIQGAVAIYVGKVVVWDTVLGLGETAPIRGAVGEWMAVVIGGMFGYAAIGRIADRFGGR